MDEANGGMGYNTSKIYLNLARQILQLKIQTFLRIEWTWERRDSVSSGKLLII